MKLLATAVAVAELLPWRDHYRREMGCQIVHDSLHARPGWTESYLLSAGGATVGYGAVAIGGPWKGRAAVFEFYVAPPYRLRLFDFFSELLSASGAVRIEGQSNDVFLTVMLHTFARDVACESILFHDQVTTTHQPSGAVFRRAAPEAGAAAQKPEERWEIELEGVVAATGGILFHYNRPYGDIYMEVVESFRRRGLGSYLVQELKRVSYEGGNVPAARCNAKNIASRKTLQKAGFVPCGNILSGTL